MILNIDSSVSDVREYISELVGYGDGGYDRAGGYTTTNIDVSSDGDRGLVRLISKSISSNNEESNSMDPISLIENTGGVLSLTTSPGSTTEWKWGVSIESGDRSSSSSGYITILSIVISGVSGLSTLSSDNRIIFNRGSMILNPCYVVFDVEESMSALLVSSRLGRLWNKLM